MARKPIINDGVIRSTGLLLLMLSMFTLTLCALIISFCILNYPNIFSTFQCLRIPPVVQNGKNKLVCASSALHDQWMCSENSWLYKLPKNSATTNKLFELAKIQGNRARARRYFCSDCINKVSQLYPAVTEPWNTTEEKNSYYMRTEPRWPSGRFDKKMKNASCVNIGQCKGDWISIKEQRACITDESVAGYLIHW